ncbi:MAG: branched-chain-amino-acid transaminase [Euryarchaeota archaeon]|nr:branched-chain-amino-acid transaminase [Euryarchaeota archaeon]MDE1837756.1 branched-chain-amino-acid transaminase [Euryarchaeota archaeon]MDE1881136.1 branched-chain-amino-acid transaminase [Euryarchaeota archaeon]MDE2045422.1 branched-chain-amino-acid transaminase [Thermoplasmata archaeon]
MREGIVYVDGKWSTPEHAKISVFDHGLLYGDGVFEGIRFYNGRVFKLDRHIDRMFESARLIGLTPSVTKEEFRDIILETCRRSGLTDGYLRPVFTRGEGDLGLDPRKAKRSSTVVICSTISLYGDKHRTGLTAIVAQVRRPPRVCLNPNVKSLNYLNNILAKSEANARGADEALMLDLEGNVAEMSADNLFVVKGRTVYTPQTSNCLVGITRETILELCEGRYPVRTEMFKLDFALQAEEVFLTGTGGEVAPVISVEGHPIGNGKPGPVTVELQQRYFDLVRSTGTPIPSGNGGSVSTKAAASSPA